MSLDIGERSNPAPIEQPRWPELAELYRPLDGEDWAWMGQRGLSRPVEGEDEQELLHELNTLMAIGAERLSTHPDEWSQTTYEVREQFIKKFPPLARLHEQAKAFASEYDHPIPTNSMVGTQRLLYGCGVDLTTASATHTILTHPVSVIESMDSLTQHGINAIKAANIDLGFIGNSPQKLAEKIRVAYSLARAWGWPRETYKDDVNRILESDPLIFHYSAHHLRVLGRISTALSFEQRAPAEEVSRDIHGLVATGLAKAVAAYLTYGQDITSPRGLRQRTRELAAFRSEELRGYIAQYPDDPVVRCYLRGYPIKDHERRYGLGTLFPERRSADWEPTASYGPDGFMTAQKAANFNQFLRSLRRMPKLDTDTESRLFTDVARGLEAEESLLLAHQLKALAPGPGADSQIAELEDDREIGRTARKRLAASFAARAIDLDSADIHRYPGKAQNRLVKLMIVIVEFGLLSEDDRRAKDFWEYAEDGMRRMRGEEFHYDS
jgi:hypothetical protein